MKKSSVIVFTVWAFMGALFAAEPKLSPRNPVILSGVAAVMTVAGNRDLLQRPRATAVVSWDERQKAYVATLDRKFFCRSCPEQSAVVDLFFLFRADREICLAPARSAVLSPVSRYFATFSGSSGDFAYSVAAGNDASATVSTSSLLDQPGQYYLFKLHGAVIEGGSLRFVPVANGEVKIFLTYKKNFSSPSVAR